MVLMGTRSCSWGDGEDPHQPSPVSQALLVRGTPRVLLLKGLGSELSKLLTQPTLKIPEFELFLFKSFLFRF